MGKDEERRIRQLAHDLTNQLTIIEGRARRLLKEHPDAEEQIKKIQAAVKRCITLLEDAIESKDKK